jgi:hypothetical protein
MFCQQSKDLPKYTDVLSIILIYKIKSANKKFRNGKLMKPSSYTRACTHTHTQKTKKEGRGLMKSLLSWEAPLYKVRKPIHLIKLFKLIFVSKFRLTAVGVLVLRIQHVA